MLKKTLIAAGVTAMAFAGAAQAQSARDYISIAGSSTVFPFSSAVAEQFGRGSRFKTPKVESVGTGGGLKLFCQGLGPQYSDVANASRRIKPSEVADCAKNGVKDIVEVKIGFDGIVLANSKAAPTYQLSRKELFMALAKQVPDPANPAKLIDNPYKTWNQIDKKLPSVKIEVLGPPPTSGTRDAFNELAIEGGCKTFTSIKALKKTDKKTYKALCRGIREDGHYIEAGENDNLIVQKLEANPNAFGVFGYSFLDQNADKIQGSLVKGVSPTFENISAQKYPVSRALYFYVKTAHVGTIPGIKKFVAEFTRERAWGPEGYLADRGLIPLPDGERKKVRKSSVEFANLSM